VREQEQQDRDQREAAAGADQRPERADREASAT
jgi:hypothetical protein